MFLDLELGGSMTVKSSWLTEKEICDQIAEDPLKAFWFHYHFGQIKFYREFEFTNKYRPDFIIFEESKAKSSLAILEVKITADIYSVSQLSEYMTFAETNLWAFACLYASGVKEPSMKGYLAARYFDKSVYPVANRLNIELFRIETKGKKISLCYEDNPKDHDSAEYCDNLQKKMKYHFFEAKNV